MNEQAPIEVVRTVIGSPEQPEGVDYLVLRVDHEATLPGGHAPLVLPKGTRLRLKRSENPTREQGV